MRLEIANIENFTNHVKPMSIRQPVREKLNCLIMRPTVDDYVSSIIKPKVHLPSDLVSKVAKSGGAKSGWTKFMSGLLAKAMKLTKFIK